MRGKNDEREPGVQTRPVKGYEGRYEVDALGRVFHIYASCVRELKPQIKKNRGGVLVVRLTDTKGKRREHTVHTLVANAFLPPCPPRHVVYHKNGRRADPALHNLGIIHRSELGKLTGHKSRRRAVVKYDWRTQQPVEVYRSARQAAKANYMSYQTVIDRCNGKVKSPIAPDGYIYQWDRG